MHLIPNEARCPLGSFNAGRPPFLSESVSGLRFVVHPEDA